MVVVVLTVKNIRYQYRADRIVLENVSFELSESEILCLLGPNGTGKTTLLRCILALNKPKSGVIELNGNPLRSISPTKRAAMMAYVPQATTVAFPYTAMEIVLMGRVSHIGLGGFISKNDRVLAAETMERLGIYELAEQRFDELSGGEKQMTLVARALAQQAKILIMDEPTANLDYHNQIKMLQVTRSLARDGIAVLMTSHYPDHAFLACTKAALMRDGLIMTQGSPDEVVTTENLTRLYSTPVTVTETLVNGTATKVCVPVME